MEIYLDVEVAHLNCTKQGLSSSTFWLGKCFDVNQVHNRTFPVGFWIPIIGQHGILIFSCLLFVLFEKTNPDIFVWSLSLCYTMVGLGIYCPKILCIQKIAEMCYFTIKNITNTHKKFLLNCKIFALISLLNVSCPTKPMLIDTLQNFLFGQ